MPGDDAPDEEALAMLDAAACALMRTTADGTFLFVNSRFCSWSGHSRDELVGRRRFQELLTMGGRIFHQTHWAPLLQMQGSISEVKLELLHRDGTAIPMMLNAVRREHDGRFVHDLAAFVARDRDNYERELIRSRIRLEEVVVEATRLQAEARDRALFAEQMVGIVSHDLRNPLSTVLMSAALLVRGGIGPGEQRTVARITRAAERANRLIGDLLDFTQARLGTGLPVSCAPIDFHRVVGEMVDELALAYQGRALRHERLGDGPCSADGDRLQQLVGNLVSNAMTYGAPDQPVTVASRIDAEHFSVAVHNAGLPIPPEMQATIFQPMVRGANTKASRSVGLGLFIVLEIAKAHGGRAEVASSADAGTTFSITCPTNG